MLPALSSTTPPWHAPSGSPPGVCSKKPGTMAYFNSAAEAAVEARAMRPSRVRAIRFMAGFNWEGDVTGWEVVRRAGVGRNDGLPSSLWRLLNHCWNLSGFFDGDHLAFGRQSQLPMICPRWKILNAEKLQRTIPAQHIRGLVNLILENRLVVRRDEVQ